MVRLGGEMRALLVVLVGAGCGREPGGEDCQPNGVDVEDPAAPAGGLNFALGPVLAQLEGDYAGTIESDAGEGPFALTVATVGTPRVVYGEEGCRLGAYRVRVQLDLDAPADGVDAVSEVDVLLPEPVFVLTLNDEKRHGASGVSLEDPAMDGGGEVLITLTSRWDGEAWQGDVTWRFEDGGFEPEGVLATWTAAR